LDQCDLIVTAVTLALHFAIGLEKKIVLFNNIFNRYEFELYGLGEIIEPNLPCLGCYKSSCDQGCMAMINPAKVFAICKRLLKSSRRD
jgi:heptosyltransferase-2